MTSHENDQNRMNSCQNKLIREPVGFEPMVNECQFNWKIKMWKEPVETTEPVAQPIISWILYANCQNFWENNFKNYDHKRIRTTQAELRFLCSTKSANLPFFDEKKMKFQEIEGLLLYFPLLYQLSGENSWGSQKNLASKNLVWEGISHP